MGRTRRALILALTIALSAVTLMAQPSAAPSEVAQSAGCMPVYMPPGLETGDFATGLWTTAGPVFMGGTEYYVSLVVQDNFDGMSRGKPGHTFKGTETAVYDFGGGDTFTTLVSYVALHQADLSKWSMNAVERVVSGTGRFANATGILADTGYYGLDEPDNPLSTTGWAYFGSRGVICGVER